ncbi:MAG: polysaccharide biosynthesis C-terminal domain-containing protein [Polyangia bacterium]|jgi:O-antigen/teichoic acid export membrane protein|nr:polysaccharide biosynthesis C-terminal domain-containing protein [Polyangia bacterium]
MSRPPPTTPPAPLLSEPGEDLGLAALREREDRAVARGALVNAIGVAGKALVPVFFILATRLYGPAIAGLYYAAWVVMDIAVSLTVSGLNSGVTMFASRLVQDEAEQDRLYQVLANGLLAGLAVSGVCILLAHLGGAELLEGASRPGYGRAIRILSLSLPFMVIPVLVVAATKAHLTMAWDALLHGFLPPILLSAFALVFHFMGLELDGLLYAHVLAHAVVTLVSLVVFGRLFSYARLFAAVKGFRFFGGLFTFAVPQNLNMTFSTFITNVDVLMLTYFGFKPELILYYGMGAQIARNVRQVKLSVSGAYSPLIARHHARGDISAMNRAFSMVSRWATMVGLPVALLCAIFRQDLIGLFHGSFTVDPLFMLILLLPPILSCTFGIAGNIVVMTGHSMWNLVNSLFVAGLNTLLNYLMIPYWGLMGAAAATLAASAALTAAQLVEADRLVGARLDLGRVWKPYAAALLPLALTILGSRLELDGTLAGRLAMGLGALGLFAAMIWLLGLDPEDRRLFGRKPSNNGKPSNNNSDEP